MKVGIIGLPNVGKSTLFKALTKKQVNISNYPFCTIEPNVGVVAIPDERLEKIADVSKSQKIIPTVIEFVDIAGLVKNAHQGEGLGNQFLSHIREVDAIVEVLRDFKDDNVSHVEGEVNPERDKDIIHLELIMADLQTVAKAHERLKKEARAGNKETVKKLEMLEKLKKLLEQGKVASEDGLSEEKKNLIKDLNLLTLKPIISIYNINENEKNRDLSAEAIKGLQEMKADRIEINAKLEAELAELPEVEVKEYLKELGIESPGLDRLIVASYNILNLITFFTFNEKEARAWTVKAGSKALEAAGKIHTDFAKGFIRAEVCHWQDFVKAGGETKAKEKGLIRIEGKDYVVQDGDVIYFRVAT